MTTLLKTFPALPITLERGEGVHVYDTDGNKYLDLYAGHAVTSTGHCHPHVVKAIQEQAGKLIFYSNAIGVAVREEAAAKLISHAPKGITQAFFANSGAEANENALKLARRHTGRSRIVATANSFHGRSAGAISVTGIEKYRKQSEPLVPGVEFIPFGDLSAAERAIDDQTAAVILEPVQSMAGVVTAPPEYFKGLRMLCDRTGAVLIYDEIQTGMGRVGTMFFAGRDGVAPDLITLAKGIASGFPMSAVLVRDSIAGKVQYGEYGATFGAGPVAMAAMKATIEVIENENLLASVTETGKILAEGMAKVPGVKEVRGAGFLLGFKTDLDAKDVVNALMRKRILVGGSMDAKVVRLLPPLTVKPEHAQEFLSVLPEVLKA